MSTKPGATTQPSASTTCAARSVTRPTATILSSRTAMSAVYAGNPLPSTTVAACSSRSRSAMHDAPGVPVFDLVDARRVRAQDLAPLRCGKMFDALHQLVDDTRVLRVGVREVARPDQVVLAGEIGHRAHRPLAGIEADDAVAPEVLARREAQPRRERPFVGLEELVEAVHPVRDPPTTAFEHEYLE